MPLQAKRRQNDEVRRRRGELGVQGDPKTSDAREWPVRTSLQLRYKYRI